MQDFVIPSATGWVATVAPVLADLAPECLGYPLSQLSSFLLKLEFIPPPRHWFL